MSKAVFCIAKTQTQAEAIVDQLKMAGFSYDDISVLFPDKQGSKDFAHEHHTKAPEGAAAGAGAGGVVGGTLGLLAGIGSLAIPGVGPFIAAGPIMGALAGLGAGAATGGIIGALSQQAGISDDEAHVYAEGLRRGGALVSVKVDDEDASRIQSIMDRSSVKIADRGAAYRKSGWESYNASAKPLTPDEVVRERSLYR